MSLVDASFAAYQPVVAKLPSASVLILFAAAAWSMPSHPTLFVAFPELESGGKEFFVLCGPKYLYEHLSIVDAPVP